MRVMASSANRVTDSFKYINLGETTLAGTSRKIGFGAFSLITGIYCAEPCTAALLQVLGAVSAARLASSTLFIVGIAAASLGWGAWRAYRRQRACADNNCSSTCAAWLTAIFAAVAFGVDVVL